MEVLQISYLVWKLMYDAGGNITDILTHPPTQDVYCMILWFYFTPASQNDPPNYGNKKQKKKASGHNSCDCIYTLSETFGLHTWCICSLNFFCSSQYHAYLGLKGVSQYLLEELQVFKKLPENVLKIPKQYTASKKYPKYSCVEAQCTQASSKVKPPVFASKLWQRIQISQQQYITLSF